MFKLNLACSSFLAFSSCVFSSFSYCCISGWFWLASIFAFWLLNSFLIVRFLPSSNSHLSLFKDWTDCPVAGLEVSSSARYRQPLRVLEPGVQMAVCIYNCIFLFTLADPYPSFLMSPQWINCVSLQVLRAQQRTGWSSSILTPAACHQLLPLWFYMHCL